MVLLIICLTVCFLPGCGSKENTAQTETSQETLEETVEEATEAPTTEAVLQPDTTEHSSAVQEETLPKAEKSKPSAPKATSPQETKPQPTEPPATDAPTDPPLK